MVNTYNAHDTSVTLTWYATATVPTGFSIVLWGIGEQLFIANGGGEGCGVTWGDTVALWGESTSLENPGPGAVPVNPANELKKLGEAESI